MSSLALVHVTSGFKIQIVVSFFLLRSEWMLSSFLQPKRVYSVTFDFVLLVSQNWTRLFSHGQVAGLVGFLAVSGVTITHTTCLYSSKQSHHMHFNLIASSGLYIIMIFCK